MFRQGHVVEGNGDAIAVHGQQCYTPLPPWSRDHQGSTEHADQSQYQPSAPVDGRPVPCPSPATGSGWRLDDKATAGGPSSGVAAARAAPDGHGHAGRGDGQRPGRSGGAQPDVRATSSDFGTDRRGPVGPTHYRQGMPSLAERLGHPADAKLLILNCDDLGFCHAANVGVYEALRHGLATSASLMVPCPWARGAAAAYRGEDVGVHLTVNAEHDLYRWGPITHAPSLLDGDGGFPRTVADVWDHADLDEVRRECRAQIERAILWGFDVSHLDAHMGTMQIKSEFFDVYLDLAVEFRLPLRLSGPETESLIGFPFRDPGRRRRGRLPRRVRLHPRGGEPADPPRRHSPDRRRGHRGLPPPRRGQPRAPGHGHRLGGPGGRPPAPGQTIHSCATP